MSYLYYYVIASSFDTSLGGFQFADQFIQISGKLDSDKVYGFGEHEKSYFKHDMNWYTWAMWARDQATNVSHRIYMESYMILLCCTICTILVFFCDHVLFK